MATRPRKTTETVTPAPELASNAEPNIEQFESSLKELEAVVARMEQGEQPLAESLRDFERGVQLTRQCQGMLQSAQQRVDVLTREGKLESFSTPDDAS
ncbi:MAG: exodeoxyribonuclease VII small subunit [Gammaproteobacteria bacterium 28-57-27]|nr:MAG: exodeoxyribonuclease VII small subunit [Gammaproteobacteria bacterium 28-57-27]